MNLINIEMSKICSKMKGPFSLIGKENIFNSRSSDLSGIYFFTFYIGDLILIEYTGITTRSFKERFLEHIKELLSGGYKIYDLGKLRNNKEFVIWNGRYGKDTDNMSVFFNNYNNFSQFIYQQIKNLKIYLLPLNKEKRIIERIEGKIYKFLKEQNDDRTMTFIKGVRSNPKYNNEELINFKILNNFLSSEIPDEFTI
jgi:hypothetical protein